MAIQQSKTAKQINLFTQIITCVKLFRFFFFFYAILSFVFWFLNVMEVKWLYLFNWLFVFPYQIVSIFYKPEGVAADFSLVIIGGVSILIGFILDFFINNLYQKIEELQEEEEKRIKAKRMRRKKTSSAPYVQQNNSQIGQMATVDDLPYAVNTSPVKVEDSKLLFIISPHISKIKKNENDIELTFQEVEIWKQRVNKKLIENFNYSKPIQKGYYRKNLFLMYKEFNYADDFIYYIKPTLASIIEEFKKYRIKLSFCNVLSAISDSSTLEKELDCMDTILSLNFLNEIVVTNRFKINYDNKATHQYAAILKGEYNLSKNLTITNRQPLYIIKDKNNRENLER